MVEWYFRLDGHEVWASSSRQWRTGKPGVLQSMGLQRVGHNWSDLARMHTDPRKQGKGETESSERQRGRHKMRNMTLKWKEQRSSSKENIRWTCLGGGGWAPPCSTRWAQPPVLSQELMVMVPRLMRFTYLSLLNCRETQSREESIFFSLNSILLNCLITF